MAFTDTVIILFSSLPWMTMFTASFLLATLIALINEDEVNAWTLQLHSNATKRYQQVGGLGKVFYAPSGLYMFLVDLVPDKGWKGGLTLAFTFFKILILVSIILLIFNNYDFFWTYMLWPLLKVILILVGILLVIVLIGARG